MRLHLAAIALVACGEPSGPSPFAIVRKLDGYERQMILDDRGLDAFARAEPPSAYTVTLETFTNGEPGSIFVRELRDGAWWSSSPSPGTFVYGEPRIEPGCDDCHAQAELPGMFTFYTAREAVARGSTALIVCAAADTEPCSAATYRDIEWLD